MKGFYKIMLPGFMTQLDLPLDFCKVVSEEFSSNAEITTCLGSWKIKVGKIRSGRRFCFHGVEWNTLVKMHDLHHLDLVEFQHHGCFRFHATIYAPSGCHKHFSPQPQPQTNVDHQEVPRHEQSADPTFSRSLSAHSGADYYNRHTSRLYLPTKLWKHNQDFLQKNKVILRISGLHTREWEANLTYYPGAKAYDRLAVAEGWYDFVCANDIKKGHYCKFDIMVDVSAMGYSKETVVIIVTKLATEA